MVNITIQKQDGFDDPLLAHNAVLEKRAEVALTRLKSLVVAKVIKIPEVQNLEFRGQQIVLRIFDALAP
jgi:dGTPase